MAYISLEEAKKIGYKEFFFIWDNLGDTILFHSAVEEHYRRTGKKLLVNYFQPFKSLFKHCPAADVLDFYDSWDIVEKYEEIINFHKIQPNLVAMHKQVKTDGKYSHEFFPDKHLMAVDCEKLGLSGQVELNPLIHFPAAEKVISNRIAVSSQGKMAYKSYPPSKMQTVINSLKHKYEFVQIGSAGDKKLSGARDMRGLDILGTAKEMQKAAMFAGTPGGLAHLARSLGKRAVLAKPAAEPSWLANYPCDISASAKTCRACAENLCDPLRNPVCNFKYPCINEIKPSDIIRGIETTMEKIKNNIPLETETVKINADKCLGVEEMKGIREMPLPPYSHAGAENRSVFLQKIFSVTNEYRGGYKHKLIILFGIKIRIKKRKTGSPAVLSAEDRLYLQERHTANLQLQAWLNKYIKPDCFNIVLRDGNGDSMFAADLARHLERQTNIKAFFIVKPSQEVILKLYGITAYAVEPLLEKEYAVVPLNSGLNPRAGELFFPFPRYYRKTPPQLFYPTTNLLDFAEKFSDVFRRLYGISYDAPVSLPTANIELKKEVADKIKPFAPFEKIIIISPEADSKWSGDMSFWHKLTAGLKASGYTVIANIIDHNKHNVDGAINDLDLSFEELVALSYKCRAVVSVISGYCNVMAGKKDKLFIIGEVYGGAGEKIFSDEALDFFSLNRNYGRTDINEYADYSQKTMDDIISKIGKCNQR